MRQFFRIFLAVMFVICFSSTSYNAFADNLGKIFKANEKTLFEKLQNLPSADSVVVISPAADGTPRYLVYFSQPVDHKDPQGAKFSQRVFIKDKSAAAPVVFVTEGYAAQYAANPRFTNELAEHFNANIITVEHRYFMESTPEPRDWQYLTVENAVNDLHRINQELKTIYNGKWITTGVSKGGQTTIMYRTYFPDDVDISVPYVGPICFGVEDGRHEPFLKKVGTKEERAAISEFQIEVLKRREEMIPMLKEYSEKRNLSYAIDLNEVLDFCVLEYPFAMWQYGTPVSVLPAKGSPTKAYFDELMKTSSPSYYKVDDDNSFMVQAARELGYYGYDTKPFKGLLSIKDTKGYLKRIMIPRDALWVEFDKKVTNDIYKFLRKNDPKMIFIYGECDPWSAAMPDPKLFKGKHNMHLFIKPRGDHGSAINNFPEDMKQQAWDILGSWIKE